MAQDYQSLAMRNDLLENENSELRRKISTWSEFVEKSKENESLLEQYEMIIQQAQDTIFDLREQIEKQKIENDSAINDLEEIKTCKICSELYDEEARQSVKLKCPHILCRSCVDALPERKCPFCRQKFFENQVKRVILET